ncbi:MAG: helix-turn-helix domain-containing protein [Hyphomicrobiales bacterium]
MVKKNPNPVDVHVGHRVRMRRVLKGMSQEKLGEQLGLTFQQVQKYEKGSNRVSASRLHQIAQILGVPVSFFFDDLPSVVNENGFAEGGSETMILEFLNTTEGLQLNKAFSEIKDPAVRRKFIELVKVLAGAQKE